ncbi:hypothetical protein Zmor_016873 [Zophobas morio]|uniref:Gamma-tubulin complex component n=1 Tax=Zophobas morio TaxID=2755281 RepID=A0AA38I8I8_9CUCU|nr:hypothetical protein Zmor_016873 [Zophobas morio]
MANPISDEIHTSVRDLIHHITTYEPDTERFATLEKTTLSTIKKSDTMYFLNTKDIKKAIWSMGEKFMFHGFFKHADYLKQTHDKYIDRNLSESDLTPRLNVVKFLLCLSTNPTTCFWKDPDKFAFIDEREEPEEVVDWGAYLSEGIGRWSPVRDDSFQEQSESDEESHFGKVSVGDKGAAARPVITEARDVQEYDFRAARTELVESVQNGWYNGEVICMKPPSDWFDASVGILWEQHLHKQVNNLIEIEPVTVISEYKVIREVLWQMWGPHSSTVFELSNKLVPRANVTISSVCSMTFEGFLRVFMPYIEMLDDFRQFNQQLNDKVCETYKSYGHSVQKIMSSVFKGLIEIENEVREQENTMTLLNLADKFEKIFQPVLVLKNIHQEVVLDDFQGRSRLECALTLLTRLRTSLQFSVKKLEQDIKLTLYLESLFYYFTMINAWLVKNDLFDHTEEFIILNKNTKISSICDNCQMNFALQDRVSDFSKDGIVRIISDQVLQIGRNIHLLRLLGKFDVFSKGEETIHQEFVRRVLQELSAYYDYATSGTENPTVDKPSSTFDSNEMGDWTNFVDLSDGFLAIAFDGFYSIEEKKVEATLFEKIRDVTTNLFPLQNLPERILSQILKERFTISGLMVKTLLIENYSLDKQFDFLNHIFLFSDDLIFPFYRRLFEKMNTTNANWGNSVWLTSHLQDVIMDLYPTFSDDCSVQVKDFWKQCRDSLEACTLLNVQYDIKWPLSIIITTEHIAMYKEVFHFLLKLKWALYTVNHLFFTDLEPKKKSAKSRAPKPTTTKRLKYLRFNLINILNTIQHYFFGFVFAKYRIQFELDFEKSNDLKSLIASHEDFIKSIHGSMVEIRDKKRNQHGFNTLMKCVKILKVMWNELEYATGENLDNCHKVYKESFEVVNAVVNPVFVFDY